MQGIDDLREWVCLGLSIIEGGNNQIINGNGFDLRLILLFCNN